MLLPRKTTKCVLGLTMIALLATANAVMGDFHLVRRIDLSPQFGPLGNNPFTVTSDGTYAYVGGYRGAADIGTIGILKINLHNPTDLTPLEPGGLQLVAQFRYYHGLVYRDGILYALTDRPGGTFLTTNVRAIDVATGELVTMFWGDFEDGDGIVYEPAILTDAGAVGGLALDPGFGPGSDGTGISIMAFGKGRRGLIDFAEGQTIYSFGDGMIVTDVSGACTVADASAWRDHVYAANGTVFGRRSNQVQKSIRNGANGIGGYAHLTDALNADGTARVDCGDGKPVQLRSQAFQVGQHLEFIPASSAGAEGADLIVFNDRYDGSTRSFADVVRLIDTNGADVESTVQFLKADGSPLDATLTPNGIGLYDFKYDADNDWLLVLDFTNRDLFVFAGTAPGCGTPAQDADDDGDVDSADSALLIDCMRGPALAWSPLAYNQAACVCLDADGDGDVDLADWAKLQASVQP